MGVLMRFWQEIVGIVADIQSIYYQVRVEPEACDTLRFCGGLEGTFQQNLVSSEWSNTFLGRHLHRALLLCLKKTAEMGEEQNQEVANAQSKETYTFTTSLSRRPKQQ